MNKIKVGFISLFLVLGISAPVRANPIADFLEGVQDGIDKAVGYYEDLVEEISKIGSSEDIVIENYKGDLGLPDLEKMDRSIEKELADKGSLDSSEALKTYVEVEAITSHANSVLGTEGQKIDKQTSDASKEAVNAVAALQQQGNDRKVSQEVLKDLLAQQTQLAGLSSTTNQALIELKQSTAYNNRAVAKQIKQNQDAQQRQLKNELESINTELAAIQLVKSSIYGSKPCAQGQTTAFVTQENGVPITPRKVCR